MHLLTPIRTVLVAVILLLASDLKAQDPISTERPSQSNSGYVLTPGRLNVETGFQYQRTADFLEDLQLNTTLLRYGINEFFELRAGFSVLQTDSQTEGSDASGTGFSPLSLGIKVKLLEERGWIPQLALTSQITLPGGQEPFQGDNVVPNMRLSAQWSIGQRGSLVYNQGVEWSEGGDRVTNAYTLLYAHALTDALTCFVETYGFLGKGQSDHLMDLGIAYLITDKVQIDAYGGAGLSDEAPDWFLAFGCSFAFIK